MVGVEEPSTGEEVGSSGLRGKPRKLVVRPKEGDLLVGRWADDDDVIFWETRVSLNCADG